MEEKIVINKARIAFRSYVELSAVMGFCLGLLFTIFNVSLGIVNLIGGSTDVTATGLLVNLVMLITGPLSGMVSAFLSYPMYKWFVNKKFSMKLTIFSLKST
jgi:uncharacterized membrane protein YqhA